MQYPHRGEGAAPSRLKGAGGEWKWHVRGQPANSTASLPPLHSCHTPVLSLSLAQLVAQETHTRTDSQRARSHVASTWRAWHSLSPSPSCTATAGKAGPSHCHRPLSGEASFCGPGLFPSLPKTSLLPSGCHSSLTSCVLGAGGGGSKQVNQGWSLLAGSPPGLRGPQGSHLASGSLRLASGMRAKQERQQSSEITLEGERARSGTGALQPQQMVLNFLLRPAPHDLSHGARMAVGRFSQSDHSPARPTSYGQIPPPT